MDTADTIVVSNIRRPLEDRSHPTATTIIKHHPHNLAAMSTTIRATIATTNGGTTEINLIIPTPLTSIAAESGLATMADVMIHTTMWIIRGNTVAGPAASARGTYGTSVVVIPIVSGSTIGFG